MEGVSEMSETEAASPGNNHTLAYLRRLDQKHGQLLELVIRQPELISRLERDMREGFILLQREMREGFTRTDRDLKEVKSDLVIAENNILNRLSEHYDTSIRLDAHDDRISELEGTLRATPGR